VSIQGSVQNPPRFERLDHRLATGKYRSQGGQVKLAAQVKAYDFHGLKIGVRAELPTLAPLIHARLRHFQSQHPGEHHLFFDFSRVSCGNKPPERSEDGWREVYQPAQGRVLYHPAYDRLFIHHDEHLQAVCDPETGKTEGWFDNRSPNLWLMSHPFFTLPLIECAKRRGLYNLHAAGLTRNGRGLLIAGTSGTGKSTLTLALMRAGFGFMGDDMVFIVKRPDGLRILGFHDEIDLTDDTARMFPELHFLLDRPTRPGWPKRQLLAEDVYDVNIAREANPEVIIFPRVAHTQRTAITPISTGQAFMELMPSILLMEKRSSQEHLNALSELARQCRSYRLDTGHDIDAIPDLLRSLLE
jgi:hypothetical protein